MVGLAIPCLDTLPSVEAGLGADTTLTAGTLAHSQSYTSSVEAGLGADTTLTAGTLAHSQSYTCRVMLCYGE